MLIRSPRVVQGVYIVLTSICVYSLYSGSKYLYNRYNSHKYSSLNKKKTLITEI